MGVAIWWKRERAKEETMMEPKREDDRATRISKRLLLVHEIHAAAMRAQEEFDRARDVRDQANRDFKGALQELERFLNQEEVSP